MSHYTALGPDYRDRTGRRYNYGNEPPPGPDPHLHNGIGEYDPDPNDFWATNGSWADTRAWGPAAQVPGWPDNGPRHNEPRWNVENSWSNGGAWAENDRSAWPQEPHWGETTDARAALDIDDGQDPDEDEPKSRGIATPTIIAARYARPSSSSSNNTGAHRVPAPPSALKGRAAVAAVAAGAVVAAGQCAFASAEEPDQGVDHEASGQIHEIAAQSASSENPPPPPAGTDSPQVLSASAPATADQFDDILESGAKYAEELAAAEAEKLRPLFSKFAEGNYTSGYGARWGVQHLGVDIAGAMGSPIYTVADGTVIDAGPASGFGMWVRVQHDDGTITVYGHIDTATVSPGEEVLAGDQIATMGNRGFSTGPHCHFEVWLGGADKVDPIPWLASRGISLGPQTD